MSRLQKNMTCAIVALVAGLVGDVVFGPIAAIIIAVVAAAITSLSIGSTID